jgi:hypothetical protein
MVEEYTSIMRSDIWDIVLRSEGKLSVSFKWTYKIKNVANDSIENSRARIMARGFSEREGVEYKETFAPIAKYDSIRVFISIASVMKWMIHQMDVKKTFPDGIIEGGVYIKKP